MTIFQPTSADEVLEAVRWAVGGGTALEIVGGGSRRGVGRPVEAGHVLDLSALSGVTLYEPEELVLSARAGTRLAEIEALLAAAGQEFAFEPMDHGPLLGGGAGKGTIGGALAAVRLYRDFTRPLPRSTPPSDESDGFDDGFAADTQPNPTVPAESGQQPKSRRRRSKP